MISFTINCVSCGNPLIECGSVVETYFGPLVVCEVCRTLYTINIMLKTDDKPVIVVQQTHFDPDEEFDIIRHSDKRIPLRDYLPKDEEKNERIVNPHFKQDLKAMIEDSVTPSDLLRKIKANG